MQSHTAVCASLQYR